MGGTANGGWIQLELVDAQFANERDQRLLLQFHEALAAHIPYGGTYNSEEPDRSLPHEALIRNFSGMFSESPLKLPPERIIEQMAEKRMEKPSKPKPANGSPPGNPPPGCQLDPGDNDGVVFMFWCCWSTDVFTPWDHDRPDTCLMTDNHRCGYRGDLLTPCAGRCGPGCASSPMYFQDCLDHDFCSDVENGGGGATDPFDRNCGDEFGEAVDDFAAIYAATFGPALFFNIAHPMVMYATCF